MVVCVSHPVKNPAILYYLIFIHPLLHLKTNYFREIRIYKFRITRQNPHPRPYGSPTHYTKLKNRSKIF